MTNSARRYEYSTVVTNGKTYKVRKSFNIFGELTRTDNWEFKPLTMEINGQSTTVQMVKWAGKDGKESSSVIFDILNITDEVKNYLETNGYEVLLDNQMKGVAVARPKREEKAPF